MSLFSSSRRGTAMRSVLVFLFHHWARRKPLVLGIMLAIAGTTLAEVAIPVVAGRLVGSLAETHADRAEAWGGVVWPFATLIALGTGAVALRHVAWIGVIPLTLRIMADVATGTFARVQRFSTDWHANTFAGSTVRQITRGMGAIDMLDDTILLALWPSAVVLTGTMVVLGAQWPVLGLVMLCGAVICTTATVLLATRYTAPAAQLSNRWDTRFGGALADALGCNAVVKAFGAEAREDTRLGAISGKWIGRTRRTWTRSTRSGTIQLALLWMLRASLIGGALLIWRQGHASAGDVAYVLTTSFVVQGYLRDIGQHVNNLQRSINEMEELVALHDEAIDIADAPDAKALRITHGAIRFENVGFRYGGHTTPLYDDLDVAVAAGERVGLVGHSGSGKSTFVKLIQRLYDVTDGRVTIDGQDVRAVTQASLRAQVAIVPQDPILFHRSLAENIAYARPGAGREAVEHAARLANAHDFIARLPKGYATTVGERGVKLSGGERQRIAIARAFLADAPILILDEATSSLDSDSEALIQDAMERLMKGRTALVIAHRLSTVRHLDRILVFDRGRIVETGTHAGLLARPAGLYRGLFERQAGGVTLEQARQAG